MVTLLLVSLLLPPHSVTSRPLRIQPTLLAWAASHPAVNINVIIQKVGTADGVEQMITDLSGRIMRDLHMINAVAAVVPTYHLQRLAQHPGVKWISLDGSTKTTGDSTLYADYQYPLKQSLAVPQNQVVFTTWATELAASNLIEGDLTKAPIAAGHSIWFNSVLNLANDNGRAVTLQFTEGQIQFIANGIEYDLPVPDATIRFSPTATIATTSFDTATNRWQTTVPVSYDKETFLSGYVMPVTTALPKDIKDVQWTGRFQSDTPDVKVKWQWAASVYTALDTDYVSLGIKPINKREAPSLYINDHKAGTPEHFTARLIRGATGDGGTDYTGSYSPWTDANLGFTNVKALLDHLGPDNLFSHGSTVTERVQGFTSEFTPGYTIGQVKLQLRAFVPQKLSNDLKVTVWLHKDHETKTVKHEFFDPYIGAEHAGLITIDVTDAFVWNWPDIENVVIEINQSSIKSHESIYIDALGLHVTNIPGQATVDVQLPDPKPGEPIDTSNLINVYNHVVGATALWNEAPAYLQGQGITVAVVDSGVGKNDDLNLQKIQSINFNRDYHDSKDKYGHGTFVAGVVAGNGHHSKGAYMGIAPSANLLNVRVSNDEGMSTESEVIEALQWILLNKDAYQIRVVNLSLNSSVPQSYHTSPLAAAVEILWFNGIVVVVSAGNNGTTELYPPANDPFVITVGATDDRGTVDKGDDVIGSFSAYGLTGEGHSKPELVAPGRNIITYVPNNGKLTIGRQHGSNRVDKNYFRMSGTSMAAPIVAGSVALLLQSEPHLTPDQVKYRLMTTADQKWPGYDPVRAGAGYLDIYTAIHGSTLESANTGIPVSNLLTTGPQGVLNSSVSWSSVSWSSVSWSSVSWSSDYWDNTPIAASGLMWNAAQIEVDSNPETTNSEGESSEQVTEEQTNMLYLPLVNR